MKKSKIAKKERRNKEKCIGFVVKPMHKKEFRFNLQTHLVYCIFRSLHQPHHIYLAS